MYSMYPSLIICKKNRFFNCVLTAFLRLDLVSIIDVKNNLKLQIYKKKYGIYKDKESPEGESISLSGQRGRPVPVTLGLQQKPTLDKITVEYLFV